MWPCNKVVQIDKTPVYSILCATTGVFVCVCVCLCVCVCVCVCVCDVHSMSFEAILCVLQNMKVAKSDWVT